MPSFTDKNKADWIVELDIGKIEDIQDTNGVDLDMMMVSPERFTELLFASPRKLVSMLYVVCADQIKERKLSPRDFANLMNRETLDSAVNALLEAIIRFYPRSAAGRTMGNRIPQVLAKMDAEIERRTNEHLDKVLSDTATVSPVSSESAPVG